MSNFLWLDRLYVDPRSINHNDAMGRSVIRTNKQSVWSCVYDSQYHTIQRQMSYKIAFLFLNFTASTSFLLCAPIGQHHGTCRGIFHIRREEAKSPNMLVCCDGTMMWHWLAHCAPFYVYLKQASSSSQAFLLLSLNVCVCVFFSPDFRNSPSNTSGSWLI